MTAVITAPDYEYFARHGLAIEDSLYRATYQAYRNHSKAEVNDNFDLSTAKFPNGANRPKFIFVHALSRLGTDDNKDVADELRQLVKDYPKSDVSEMAGMIVKGIESGRILGSGTFDVGSLWSRRSSQARQEADSLGQGKTLQPDRLAPFVCLIAYPTDSLNDNLLLYDVAHFNFTGFMVRNFEMTFVRDRDITQLRIAGFHNHDEAHAYAQRLIAVPSLSQKLQQARIVIISQANLELLGSAYSFDEYKEFYDKTFAPIQINPNLPIDNEDGDIQQRYEDEFTPEELERLKNGSTTEEEGDDDGWY